MLRQSGKKVQSYFFLLVLELELCTLHLLGRHTTIQVMPPALFGFFISQTGSHTFSPKAGL
jgi:hypothetical protein